MTLRGILAVQEAFNRSGRGKASQSCSILSSRMHPLGRIVWNLTCHWHVYSSFLHSPESRSLIYWRMPGLSYRPFECGATNVRRQHFCAINHCVNSQQRKRFHASINQKGGYTPFEANNTNTCPTSQNAEFCSGGGQFKSEYVATLYWERKPIPPTPLGFPDAFGKFGWMETANFG